MAHVIVPMVVPMSGTVHAGPGSLCVATAIASTQRDGAMATTTARIRATSSTVLAAAMATSSDVRTGPVYQQQLVATVDVTVQMDRMKTSASLPAGWINSDAVVAVA